MLIPLIIIMFGLLIQPVWRSVFYGPSVPAYIAGLAAVAIGWVLLLIAMLKKLRRRRAEPQVAGPLRWGLLCLTLTAVYLAAELIVTAHVVLAGRRMELYDFRHKELLAGTAIFVPHPFLLFTKNPALPNVNDFGFFGEEWTLEKPAGTFRVACIGGSTTEDGYPYFLELALKRDGAPRDFQAMNFGTAGWTSVQSLVNYSLNVRHFDPDCIIIHDAANDFKTVGFSQPRTDYSHAFQNPRPLTDPWDAPLVRYLNSYALLKMAWRRARHIPPGPSLSDFIELEPDAFNRADEQIAPAVEVFRANIGALITLAQGDRTHVILTTMPHSRTNANWSPQFLAFMEAANQALRELADERNIALTDLDRQIMGENSFKDPVHLTQDAVKLKGEMLAGVVLQALGSTTATQSAP